MKPFHLLLTCFCLVIPAETLAQRPDWGALQDSLSAITDVPLLYRLEGRLERPRTAPGAEPIIRRGLIALRIYELTGDREDAKRAQETFETGAERFPADPWLHHGAALALARGPEVRLPLAGEAVTLGQSLAEIVGRDPRSRARRAARRALELDAGLAPAAVLLGELALADGGRSRDLLTEARTALGRLRTEGRATPRSDRALADIEIALGNFAAADAAAAGAGADAGVLRARAVAVLRQDGQAERGAALYHDGIRVLDAEAAGQYYADLEVLVTPREEAEWRIAGMDGRRVWLERFWERRAAEGGVTVAERLAEHYRRLLQARSRYLRNSTRGVDGSGVLLADDGSRQPFDDRGVVLIRHGDPLDVVRTSGRGILPNETWVYDLPGQGRQLFHFAALRGSQSFMLISDLLQALDPNASLYVEERDRAVLALVADRARVESRYQAMLARLERALAGTLDLRGTEVRSILESVDADYRRGARVALRTDTHAPSFSGEVELLHDVFSFRTPEERTEVTGAFAVHAARLQPVPGTGSEYALRLSVILHDTLQDVVTRRDTVVRVRRQGDDHYVRAHVTLPVLPSEHTVYRLVARDATGGAGRVTAGGSVIRDLAGPALMVSDVVLALPDSAGDWVRGNLRLALALPRSFEPERPFTVFYEVYNIAEGSPYSTRITVEPAERRGGIGRLFGGRAPGAIDLRFDDTARLAPGGVLQESRRVASDLPAGRYRMVVTVTSEGRTARTETLFSVDR